MSAVAEAGQKPDKKAVTIIVNGTPHEVARDDLSYEDVVALAFGGNLPYGPNTLVTMTYSRGPGNKPEGALDPGETVKAKDRMVFSATATDRS